MAAQPEPGDRVGAILSEKEGMVNFLGYGVYLGDFQPPKEIFDQTNLAQIGFRAPITNPKIRLDNGRITWGCVCWWGPEDQIRRQLEGKHVTLTEKGTYTEVNDDLDTLRHSLVESFSALGVTGITWGDDEGNVVHDEKLDQLFADRNKQRDA